MAKSRWDTTNWTTGKATILGSMGLPWKLKYPSLKAPISEKAATANPQPASNPNQQLNPGGPSSPSGSPSPTGSPTPVGGGSPSHVAIPKGGIFSKAQLEAIWIQAGGNPAKANIAAAIALAESSGNSNAISPTQDYGLWQINRAAHPSQWTLDPLANARAAVAISSNGTNWTPWTTYNTGAYRSHL